MIAKLGEKLEYNNTVTFLKESVFLDCQADGKSQKSILLIIKEMLLTDFNFKMDEAGSTTKKNYIYVDDILCTGKTLYDNVSKWGSEQDGEEKFIDKLKSKKITLNVLYLAASQSAYDKKMGQLYYHFDKRFNQDMVNPLVGRWIDKNRLKPVPNQPIQVFNYEEEVTRVVEAYVASKYAIENDFYRSEKLSFVEEFFSSEANRTRLENIFLLKGVEILNRATTTMQNIRPLGFTLPSFKNFGFGAMFFTWRNVPNNTPLVFWYRGGGFSPLFENVR